MLGVSSAAVNPHSFDALPTETNVVKMVRWKRPWTLSSGPKSDRFRPWADAATLMGVNGRTFATATVTGETKKEKFDDGEAAKLGSCWRHSSARHRGERRPLFKSLPAGQCSLM